MLSYPAEPIYSIGHSNKDIEHFLCLLRTHQIDVVADVRSKPASTYAPQFTRLLLENSLKAAALKYVFLGAELGGRPSELMYYDHDGRVLYDKVAASERFAEGLARLERGAKEYRVAMLCSEEDPTNCHRRLLIARVLLTHGHEVRYIRGDACLQTETELRSAYAAWEQPDLFGGTVSREWKSTQSVLQKRPLLSSSAN